MNNDYFLDAIKKKHTLRLDFLRTTLDKRLVGSFEKMDNDKISNKKTAAKDQIFSSLELIKGEELTDEYQ